MNRSTNRKIIAMMGSSAAILALALVGCDPSAGGTSSDSTKSETTSKRPELVTFKVWGSAPSGVDVTYGSDSDSRSDGNALPVTKTLPLNDDALYYTVTAQLSGSGDINCSVTVKGKTKTAHASGGYNLCMAQLNSGFGGW